MNKKFLFVGIFYVLFSIIFFFLTFGRLDDVCIQTRDVISSVPEFENSHVLEKGVGFICALKYVFLAFSFIALMVGVLCIIKSFKTRFKR